MLFTLALTIFAAVLWRARRVSIYDAKPEESMDEEEEGNESMDESDDEALDDARASASQHSTQAAPKAAPIGNRRRRAF